jgi:ankyrin repeat protein
MGSQQKQPRFTGKVAAFVELLQGVAAHDRMLSASGGVDDQRAIDAHTLGKVLDLVSMVWTDSLESFSRDKEHYGFVLRTGGVGFRGPGSMIARPAAASLAAPRHDADVQKKEKEKGKGFKRLWGGKAAAAAPSGASKASESSDDDDLGTLSAIAARFGEPVSSSSLSSRRSSPASSAAASASADKKSRSRSRGRSRHTIVAAGERLKSPTPERGGGGGKSSSSDMDPMTRLKHVVRQDRMSDLMMLMSTHGDALDLSASLTSLGNTALHIAAKHSYAGICISLQKHGASVSAVNSLGETPLHLLAKHATHMERDYAKALVSALSEGIDVDAMRTENGESALHYAACGSMVALVDLLVEIGARTDVVNRAGRTPFDLAIEQGDSEAVARRLSALTPGSMDDDRLDGLYARAVACNNRRMQEFVLERMYETRDAVFDEPSAPGELTGLSLLSASVIESAASTSAADLFAEIGGTPPGIVASSSSSSLTLAPLTPKTAAAHSPIYLRATTQDKFFELMLSPSVTAAHRAFLCKVLIASLPMVMEPAELLGCFARRLSERDDVTRDAHYVLGVLGILFDWVSVHYLPDFVGAESQRALDELLGALDGVERRSADLAVASSDAAESASQKLVAAGTRKVRAALVDVKTRAGRVSSSANAEFRSKLLGAEEHGVLELFSPSSKPITITFDALEPMSIARHLTLWASALLRKVTPRHLLHFVRKLPGHGAQVRAIIDHFNIVSKWLSTTILNRGTSVEQRLLDIAKFLEVAHLCLSWHDYHTAMALNAGFAHTSIFRLKLTWSALSPSSQRIFDALRSQCAATSNYGGYRRAIAELEPSTACVPYLPALLSDLTYVNDGQSDRFGVTRPLINFVKLKWMYAAMHDSWFRHFAAVHKFATQPRVADYLSTIDACYQMYDDNKLQELSYRREPRGELGGAIDELNASRSVSDARNSSAGSADGTPSRQSTAVDSLLQNTGASGLWDFVPDFAMAGGDAAASNDVSSASAQSLSLAAAAVTPADSMGAQVVASASSSSSLSTDGATSPRLALSNPEARPPSSPDGSMSSSLTNVAKPRKPRANVAASQLLDGMTSPPTPKKPRKPKKSRRRDNAKDKDAKDRESRADRDSRKKRDKSGGDARDISSSSVSSGEPESAIDRRVHASVRIIDGSKSNEGQAKVDQLLSGTSAVGFMDFLDPQ